MGRGDLYESVVKPRLPDISKWYKDLTEGKICKKLGISRSSWERYKRDHDELRKALTKGKEILADELKDALRKKGFGFFYTEKKTVRRIVNGVVSETEEEYTRYSPPDVGAIHLLLKNIDENWTNDDKTTLDLKRQKIELEKRKTDEAIWDE